MNVMAGRIATVGCLCAALLYSATPAAAQEAPQAPQPVQSEAPKFKIPEPKKNSGPSFGQVMKDTFGDFKRLPHDNTVPILALGATFAATALTYDRSFSTSFGGTQDDTFKA